MKSFISLLLAVLALGALCTLTACQGPESRVRNVSETFLNAYYTGENAAAAAVCTRPFAERLLAFGLDVQEDPPEVTRQKIKEALSGTSFVIVSVELDEGAASARVRYDLTVPGLEKPVPKVLKLQLEGRTALVDGIE